MNQVASVTVDDLKKQLRKKTQMKGRKADDLSLREVENLLGQSISRRDLLIENLHVLNDALNGLPERHLVALSQLMNISMAEVYEVATFYHHFEVLRDGVVNPQITIRVCNSVSCELAGANDLLERLPKILNSAEVRVVPVPCIGRCEQAPAVVVNQHPATLANLEKVTSLVEMKKVLHPLAKDTKFFNPLDYVEKSVTSLHDETISPDYCGLDTYQDHGGYQLLQAVVTGKIELETVLKNMEDSGLRGLGGAGFPAGRKWRIVRDQPAPRLMAVNIDEGEPGTFKDRTYLERYFLKQ
jgi:formate dehydrogenase